MRMADARRGRLGLLAVGPLAVLLAAMTASMGPIGGRDTAVQHGDAQQRTAGWSHCEPAGCGEGSYDGRVHEGQVRDASDDTRCVQVVSVWYRDVEEVIGRDPSPPACRPGEAQRFRHEVPEGAAFLQVEFCEASTAPVPGLSRCRPVLLTNT